MLSVAIPAFFLAMLGFPARPAAVSPAWDAAAFAALREENRRLTRLMSFHRDRPAQHAPLAAERESVRRRAHDLIAPDIAPDGSPARPPTVSLTEELHKELCEAATWAEGWANSTLKATLRSVGQAPEPSETPQESSAEPEPPTAAGAAERLVAACRAIRRGCDEATSALTQAKDAKYLARQELRANEVAGRLAAAERAKQEAALAQREREHEERHARFEALARDRDPALAALRRELEESQATTRHWENSYREMLELNEQKRDQLGARDRKAAQQKEVIQSLHQVLATREASDKDARVRILRAEKEAREMALTLAAYEERARSWCYVGGGETVRGALPGAQQVARPPASGERKRLPSAPRWAERLRKRLRR